MRNKLICLFSCLVLTTPIYAQMSPEEALERLKEREAAQTRPDATTQPDYIAEINNLREIIAELKSENADLKRQIAALENLSSEVPKVGWSLQRIAKNSKNKIVDQLSFFDVHHLTNGGVRLEQGEEGARVNEVVTPSQEITITKEIEGNSNAAVHTTQSIPEVTVKCPQWHLYLVTTETSGEPATYDVYVDVDTGMIASVHLHSGAPGSRHRPG